MPSGKVSPITKGKDDTSVDQNDGEELTSLEGDKPVVVLDFSKEGENEPCQNKVNVTLLNQLKEKLESQNGRATDYGDTLPHPKSASHSRSHSAHRVPVANS